MPGTLTLQQALQQAIGFRQQGAHPMALRVVDTALSSTPGQLDLLHLKGLILTDMGQNGDAQALLKQLLLSVPNRTDIRFHLATICKRMQDSAALNECLLPLGQDIPATVDQLVQAGHMLFDLGTAKPEAYLMLQRAFDAGGREPHLLGMLVRAAAEVSDWPNCYRFAELLEPLLEDEDTRFICFFNKVTAATYLGLYDRHAEEHLRRAIDLKEPENLAAAIFNRMRYTKYDGPALVRDATRAANAARVDCGPLTSLDRDPNAPIRVGYLGPMAGTGLTQYQITPMITGHDRTKFTPVVLQTFAVAESDYSIYGDCEIIDLSGLEPRQAVERVRDAELDIVIDWAGHTSGQLAWLPASRLAPLQVAMHFAPTGIPETDSQSFDSTMIPRSTYTLENLYGSVKPIMMPYGWQLWLPPDFLQHPITATPSRTSGRITFGSFNAIEKLSDETLTLWQQVLAQVENSRLIIKARQLKHPNMLRFWTERLKQAGLPLERCQLLGEVSWDRHLDLYREIDIMLDCTPYTGSLTTTEALYHGIPVVSLAGNLIYSRMGAQYLTQVGHPDLIATTAEEYVSIATALAHDPERLDRLRHSLREALLSAPVTQSDLFMRQWEKDLLAAWKSKTNS